MDKEESSRHIPSFIKLSNELVKVQQNDLRFRHSSQAAILAQLPSKQAMYSDVGMSLARKLSSTHQKKELMQRKKSSVFPVVYIDEEDDDDDTDEGFVLSRRMSRQTQRSLSMVDGIESKMEQWERRQSIKCMVANLQTKRKYRDQILQEPSHDLHGVASWRYQQIKTWQNFKDRAKNLLYYLEPWAVAFKTIEGHFGTAVMTYFRFMRWILFLNLYMMVTLTGLTLIPFLILHDSPKSFIQTLHHEPCNQSKVNSTFLCEAVSCSAGYSQFVQENMNKENTFNDILDILQGTGWMENKVLFYGAYFNKTYSIPGIGDDMTYDMGLLYLFATGAVFIISFFLIVRNSGKGMKESVMDEGSQMVQYCNKVFGGWDFCISDEKAAKEKHKNLTHELAGDLENQKLLWKKKNRTKKERAKLYSIRVVVNLLVLGLLGGSLVLIYYCNDQLISLQKEFGNIHAIVQFLIQFLPSLTITILNIIVPIFFKKLVLLEDYMPAFQIRVTLFRTVILRLSSLLVLMVSLYGMVEGKNSKYNSACGNQRWEAAMTGDDPAKNSSLIKCWETYVGQQIYKLIILDFLVPVILTFVVEYPRRLVYQRWNEKYKVVKMMGQQEFDLPKAVLDLVYSQTLCWMGLFFCPLIPAMCVVKCFIFFYVKKGSVLNNCIQPVRPFRTSKSNSLFIAVLFFSFILATGPMTYMIGRINPSQSCGPFRVYSKSGYVFFDVVRNLIFTFPREAQDVFFFVGTTAFFIPAIVIICFMIYLSCVQTVGYKRKVKLLKEQLILEGRDKQFLLAQVNEAWVGMDD